MVRPIFISFATQKGGVGKTTLTVITASLMHYQYGLNVAIVDCDYPQHSIGKMRDRELASITETPRLKNIAVKQFGAINKKAFTIDNCEAKNALATANRIIENSQEQIDVIFFDIPGTVNQEGVISLLTKIDYLFCPMTSDEVVITSSANFIGNLKEQIMDKGIGIKGIYMLWNSIDAREKNSLCELYTKAIEENYKIPFLSVQIPNLSRFRKEIGDSSDIFRSTILSPSQSMIKDSKMDILVTEICDIINLPIKK